MTLPIGPSGGLPGGPPGAGVQPPDAGGVRAGGGAQPSDVEGPKFQQQFQAESSAAPGAPQNLQLDQGAGIKPATQPTDRVNALSPAAKSDVFARFDHVRGELRAYTQKSAEMDKLVAEGKLKPNDPQVLAARRDEMRQLLFLQSEMQGAAMKVEIASKVVEHGTSGVKTVLQTQA